jgi:hypothetical protein
MPKLNPKKIVVVTTKPEPWHDGPKQPTPALKEIWDAADELRDDDDQRAKLLFQPPAFRPIEVPTQIFDTYNKQQKFIVACHEVGHALASMMVCRPTQALTVTELNGSIRGGANTTDAHPPESE